MVHESCQTRPLQQILLPPHDAQTDSVLQNYNNNCVFSPFFIKKNAIRKIFLKKVHEKFGSFKKTPYLCTRIQNNAHLASVAQLVRAPDC